MTQLESEFKNATLPSRVLEEALSLSADILEDIELSKADLTIIVLKTLRLARLLNDYEEEKIFKWESSGYPVGESGVTLDVWSAAEKAGRTYYGESKDGESRQQMMYTESIEKLSSRLEFGKMTIEAADNPRERSRAVRSATLVSERLSHRRTFIYDYASRKHYELRFSNLVGDIFERIRSSIDSSIGTIMPDEVRKLSSVSDNLNSDNPEDWANAAHSCRRLLQELADAVFPPQSETRTREPNGKPIKIKLGPDHYINRIVAFIEDASKSDSYQAIVGSHLRYIGERLDAIFSAAQKGSHSRVTKREAERCVVYTYLLVGDILSLHEDSTTNPLVSIGSVEAEIVDIQ